MKHIVSFTAGGFAVIAAVAALVIGAAYAGGSLPSLNGDVDCSGSVGPVDSLKILRYDAGLSNSQASGCAPIGDSGSITPPTSTPAPPTPTPSPTPANQMGPYSGTNIFFTPEFCVATNFVTVDFVMIGGSGSVELLDSETGIIDDFDVVNGQGSTKLFTGGPGCFFVEVDGFNADSWTILISW